VDLGGWMR
jgi:transposase